MNVSNYYIQQRQEGNDVLSWIENFGLHLLDKDCKPRVSFEKGEKTKFLYYA